MSTEDNKTPQEQENATEGSTPARQEPVTLNWPTWIGLVVDGSHHIRRLSNEQHAGVSSSSLFASLSNQLCHCLLYTS